MFLGKILVVSRFLEKNSGLFIVLRKNSGRFAVLSQSDNYEKIVKR